MIVEKLLSFNTKLQAEEVRLYPMHILKASKSTRSFSLDSEEISHLHKLVNTLKNSTQYHITNFTEEEHNVILKTIRWPIAERFPGITIIIEV